MEIRRLRPGDEDLVERLATLEPQTAVLGDERALFVVALEDEEPVGFLLAYELPRRHGAKRHAFVYELGVAPSHRRRGIATALWRELEALCRERGIGSGFLLTNEVNEAAMSFYASLGARRPNQDDVLWDFDVG